MRPVSDRFLRTLRGSHTVVTRVRLITSYQEGTNPTGVDLDVTDGDVLADAKADIRQTVDLTVAEDWGPLLTPYGNEIHVARGLLYGNGQTELVSLGYFQMGTVEQPKAPRGLINLAGRDRMGRIVDGRLPAPVQFTAATTVGAAITALVSPIYPTATIVYDDSTASLPLGRSVLVEEDRYGGLKNIATSFGKVAYWDYRGRLMIVTPPDPSEPVWDINAGAYGVLIEHSRSLTNENVYNGVVVTGEGTGDIPPVRALVVNNDPASPTYWFGTFGQVPKFYSSPLITTVLQATSTGEKILLGELGLPYAVDFRAVPNVALEVTDPVWITNSTGSEIHILDTLRFPITNRNPMVGTSRTLTDTILGVI